MISAISTAQASTIQASVRVQTEQERQQHAERHQVEKGRQQLAGEELAHPIDLAILYIVSPAGWRSK